MNNSNHNKKRRPKKSKKYPVISWQKLNKNVMLHHEDRDLLLAAVSNQQIRLMKGATDWQRLCAVFENRVWEANSGEEKPDQVNYYGNLDNLIIRFCRMVTITELKESTKNYDEADYEDMTQLIEEPFDEEHETFNLPISEQISATLSLGDMEEDDEEEDFDLEMNALDEFERQRITIINNAKKRENDEIDIIDVAALEACKQALLLNHDTLEQFGQYHPSWQLLHALCELFNLQSDDVEEAQKILCILCESVKKELTKRQRKRRKRDILSNPMYRALTMQTASNQQTTTQNKQTISTTNPNQPQILSNDHVPNVHTGQPIILSSNVNTNSSISPPKKKQRLNSGNGLPIAPSKPSYPPISPSRIINQRDKSILNQYVTDKDDQQRIVEILVNTDCTELKTNDTTTKFINKLLNATNNEIVDELQSSVFYMLNP